MENVRRLVSGWAARFGRRLPLAWLLSAEPWEMLYLRPAALSPSPLLMARFPMHRATGRPLCTRARMDSAPYDPPLFPLCQGGILPLQRRARSSHCKLEPTFFFTLRGSRCGGSIVIRTRNT